MEPFRYERRPGGRLRVFCPFRGRHLLDRPMFNKSTAFSGEERRTFGVDGLLPGVVSTMEQQARRAYGNLERKTDPLERYIGLAALQDRSEPLFYRVLVDHLEELLPIVYTPTVGRACQEYSRIFRRARGLWINPGHRGRIYETLGNAPYEDVRLIVATDNESILGIGDQGAGGMPIPVGKLALYSAAAGIHPAFTLPVSLDVGTDNQWLLADELYVGWRQPRLRGAPYDALVDEFVQAVKRRFPRALLQWEDFRKGTAFALLDRYRRELPSFNDDVQGTGATLLAALTAGARATGVALADQRVVILGGGAAGAGIGRMLRLALARAGLSGDALQRAIAVVDLDGLMVDDRPVEEYRRELTWPAELARAAGLGERRDLFAVVGALHPTALVGVSGAAGAFDEAVVREMARHVARPLVLPLSNPTAQAEATPGDVLIWTEGRALVATGSPFPPVRLGERSVRVAQGNNALVFPGIGLGAIVAEAREVTDGMLLAAAEALAAQVSPELLAEGALLPPIGSIREVTAAVAEAVVRAARDAGVGLAIDDADVPGRVAEARWEPEYPELVPT
ncbi:MAG: NAD-dependent malic enzyme [Vicinamibacteria bacterium]